jgi:D-alanine transaminase
LYDRNGFSNQYFYIQVTRGVQEFRSHQDNSIKAPTVFITSQNLELNPYRINPDKKGLRVRLEEDIRWARCDIKTTGLIGNVLPLHDQTKDQVDEIIFHKDGRINEGSKSNVFFVKDNVVYTPSLKQNILPGVTRAFVIELLKKNKIPLFEESIPLSFIHDSDEIWLTSSTKEIQPIEIIDDYKLPKNNSDLLIWKRLLNSFNQL